MGLAGLALVAGWSSLVVMVAGRRHLDPGVGWYLLAATLTVGLGIQIAQIWAGLTHHPEPTSAYVQTWRIHSHRVMLPLVGVFAGADGGDGPWLMPWPWC